jgi:hypothetical protein
MNGQDVFGARYTGHVRFFYNINLLPMTANVNLLFKLLN